MSFDLPINVEGDLERYVQDEHIASAEVVVKLVQSGKRKAKIQITEADLETLRQNLPIFAFMEKLPDEVIQGMQAASKEFRAERFPPRG